LARVGFAGSRGFFGFCRAFAGAGAESCGPCLSLSEAIEPIWAEFPGEGRVGRDPVHALASPRPAKRGQGGPERSEGPGERLPAPSKWPPPPSRPPGLPPPPPPPGGGGVTTTRPP